MFSLAHVPIKIYIFIIAISHQQIVHVLANDNPPLCCKSQCGTKVFPAAANIIDIINDSPYYFHVTSRNIYSQTLDNECFTYFKRDETSYTLFIGVRYLNGSGEFRTYTTFALRRYSGVSRNQKLAEGNGSCSFIFDEVYLGDACPGVKVFYRNYALAPCDFIINVKQDVVDYVYGDSSSRNISEYCKSRVAVVANSQPLRGTQLIPLPNRLNRLCVTQFNGASCVNAERVLPQDSVSVNF